MAVTDVKIVFIPDYLEETLKEHNISPIMLSQTTKEYDNVFYNLINSLKGVIAEADIDMIRAINKVMYIYLNIKHSTYIDANDVDVNEVLNLYKKDIPDALVDILDDNNKMKLFYPIMDNNVIFIIVKPGISDFIIRNNVDDKQLIAGKLIDYMFKGLQEDTVLKSELFNTLHKIVVS